MGRVYVKTENTGNTALILTLLLKNALYITFYIRFKVITRKMKKFTIG